jgi:hypothetical protein
MNTLMLVVLAVVLLCYCGGKYCPKVLSSNKEMLLGVLVGLALCSIADLRMEGFDSLNYMTCMQGAQRIMNDCRTQWEEENSTSPPPLSEELRAQVNTMLSPPSNTREEPLQRLNIPNNSQSETAAQMGSMFSPQSTPSTPMVELQPQNNP